jgi:hypothetical protein
VPYRLQGNAVQVERAGRWVTLKSYPTRAQALAYLRALYANVGRGHR